MKYRSYFLIKNTNSGKGIFANKKLKKGELIIEFKGRIMSYKELPSPYRDIDDHYVQIGKYLYMGPSGNFDDFINHSCEPNSGLKIQDTKVVLIALKGINIGDEITWDYSTTMDEDDWEMICKCQSKKCRKVIQDFKYLPKYIQDKYLNLQIVPSYISNKFHKSSK